MVEVPVPEIIEARYSLISFEIILEIQSLLVVTLLPNRDIKTIGVSEVLASVAVIIECCHNFMVVEIESF